MFPYNKKIAFLFFIYFNVSNASYFLFPPSFGCKSDDPFSALRTTECNCGRTPGLEDKIVGGTTAKIEEFPWMAQVYRDGSLICGATIISNKYVLTAAHCIGTYSASSFKVGLGAVTTDSPEEKVDVDTITVHESYESTTKGSDIAVLKLAETISYTDNKQPICLPCQPKKYDISYIFHCGDITGWGRTSANGPVPTDLQKGKRFPMNDNWCRISVLPPLLFNIPDKTICGRGIKADACNGDSGGPFSMNVNGVSYQMGITSFGVPCGKIFKPAIYTDVSEYADWIVSKTGDSEYCSI